MLTSENLHRAMAMSKYPKYLKYDPARKHPSVLDQEFPIITDQSIAQGKRFYPKNEFVEKYLDNDLQSMRFEASCFCGFLHDTIAVEHDVVIPAIASIRYLPFPFPSFALEDLYQLVTDEGHHAAQAEIFLNSIAKLYRFEYREAQGEVPRFLARLGRINSALENETCRRFCDVIAGVITETRVSIELRDFANNPELLEPVRATCQSHQDDEVIHASQFRALGTWLWQQIGDEHRSLVGQLFATILISRSLPDIKRMAFYLAQATGMARERCGSLIESVYVPEVLEAEVLQAARPTLRFLKEVGVAQTDAFQLAFNNFDYNQV